jgi:hypothetical protein
MFWKRKRATEARQTLWLVKDDPDGSWCCECPEGIVDAPWHDRSTYPTDGNGWLFICVRCGKAFMFARAVRIRPTLEELAERSTPRTQRVVDPKAGRIREEVLLATPDDWLDLVRPLQAELTEGQRYVFFDGRLFPAVHGPVRFRGLWRSHDLADLPHLAEPPVSDVLDDPEYWLAESTE